MKHQLSVTLCGLFLSAALLLTSTLPVFAVEDLQDTGRGGAAQEQPAADTSDPAAKETDPSGTEPEGSANHPGEPSSEAASAHTLPTLDLSTPAKKYLITFSSEPGPLQEQVEQAVLELHLTASSEAFASYDQLLSHPTAGTSFDIRARRVAALQATAILAQQEARTLLQDISTKYPEADLEYNSYWISNTLALKAPQSVVDHISALSNVRECKEDQPLQSEPVAKPNRSQAFSLHSVTAAFRPQEVEANLDAIRASKVWSDLNITGKGVVVGIIDQAVDYEHPALIRHFRGFDPETNQISLEGNYVDFVEDGSVGGDTHGTHVAGIVVGEETRLTENGAAVSYNQTGVAPGAKFIVARAFKEGAGGTNENIIKACEWMMAPGGDPAKAPQIVNQSWSDGKQDMDLWFEQTAKAFRSAGILNVMSSGNNGSTKALPGSVDNPGSSDQVFTVGASDNQGGLADFSRRGPSPYPNATFKPDIVAPGVQIRSAVPGNAYTSFNGTSMAAPHVAGTAALMLEANPSLSLSELEDLLRKTAIPRTDSDYDTSPNQGYGYGSVDAYQAVQAALHAAGKEGTPSADYRAVKGTVQAAKDPKAVQSAIPEVEIRLPQSGYTDRPLVASVDLGAGAFSPKQIARLEYLLEGSENGAPFTRKTELKRESSHSRKFSGAFSKEETPLPGNYSQKIRLTTKDGATFETAPAGLTVFASVRPGEYRTDFESGAPGFAYSGNFSHGVANLNVDPKPVSGNFLAGLNIGSPYLGALKQSLLELPRLDLTGLGETDKPELVFQEYASWDSGVLGIQAEIKGEGTVKIYNYPTKINNTWQERRIDLSPLKGKVANIFFFHLTAGASDGYGLFLDDLSFTLNGTVQDSLQLKEHLLTEFTNTAPGGSDSSVIPLSATIQLEGEGLQTASSEMDGSFTLEKVPFTKKQLLVGAKGYKTKRIRLEEGTDSVDLGTILLERDNSSLPLDEPHLKTGTPGPGMKQLGYDNNNPLSGGAALSRPQTGVATEIDAPKDGVLSHVMVYFAGENPYFRNGKVSLEIKQLNEAGRLIDLIPPQTVEGKGGQWNKYDLSSLQIQLSGKAYVIVRQLLPKGEGPAVAIDASVRPGTLDYAKGKYYNGSFESLFGQGIFGMPMIRTYVRTHENVQDPDAINPVFDPSIPKTPHAETLVGEGQKPKDLITIGDYEISPSRGMITEYLKKDDLFQLPLEERILNIPAEIGGVKIVSIGESAFGYSWGSYEMQKIVLPEGIKEVNESAFSMLGSHELSLPGTLEKIYPRAFKQQKLSSLTLPEGLRHIGMGAFENCYQLEQLSIPDSVETIEAGAFQVSAWGDDSHLTAIHLPENHHFTTIPANAFANHKLITQLTIPSQITAIRPGAFTNLGIRQLVLPDGLTELGSSAFEGCSALEEVTLPNTLTEIGSNAFFKCALTSVRLPVNLEVIDRSAFEGNRLTSVVIPEKVRFINYRAFAGNPLHTLRLNTTLVPRTPQQGTAKQGYPTVPHPFGDQLLRLEVYRQEQADKELRAALEAQTPKGEVILLGKEAQEPKTFTSADGSVSLSTLSASLPSDAKLVVEPVSLEEADYAAISKLAGGRTIYKYSGYRFHLATPDGKELPLPSEYQISFKKNEFTRIRTASTTSVRKDPVTGIPQLIFQPRGGTWMRIPADLDQEAFTFRENRFGQVSLLEVSYQPGSAPSADLYYGAKVSDKLAPPKFALITRVKGGHGSISDSRKDLTDGSDTEVHFSPDPGYEVDSVTINGQPVTVSGLISLIRMDEDKEVVVTYRKSASHTPIPDTPSPDMTHPGGDVLPTDKNGLSVDFAKRAAATSTSGKAPKTGDTPIRGALYLSLLGCFGLALADLAKKRKQNRN